MPLPRKHQKASVRERTAPKSATRSMNLLRYPVASTTRCGSGQPRSARCRNFASKFFDRGRSMEEAKAIVAMLNAPPLDLNISVLEFWCSFHPVTNFSIDASTDSVAPRRAKCSELHPRASDGEENIRENNNNGIEWNGVNWFEIYLLCHCLPRRWLLLWSTLTPYSTCSQKSPLQLRQLLFGVLSAIVPPQVCQFAQPRVAHPQVMHERWSRRCHEKPLQFFIPLPSFRFASLTLKSPKSFKITWWQSLSLLSAKLLIWIASLVA